MINFRLSNFLGVGPVTIKVYIPADTWIWESKAQERPKLEI